MNFPPMDTSTSEASARSIGEMVGEKKDLLDRLFGWWYRLTMPPQPPANASILKKEAYRQHRTISTVGILFLCLEIMDIAVVVGANSMVMNVDYALVYIFIAAMMVANRFGRPVLAGSIPVFGCEILLVFTIIYMYPEMNIVSIMFYGLFVFIELLSISLLPIRFVFVFAILDSAFIVLDYFFQPKSAELIQAIGSGPNGLVVFGVPVALQFLVAFISALWVSTAKSASKRANRAEMMAAIESAVAKDRLLVDQEKQELEASIQQLVQAYTDTNSGRMIERIPYPPTKVLWPLVGVLNMLWMRLRSAQHTEAELARLKQAITAYDALLQRMAQTPNQSLPLLRTGTDIDLLNISLQAVQKSWKNPSKF